jgi:hypothetical protein
VAFLVMLVFTVFGGIVMAAAPNSGDCVPDGPGWDSYGYPHPGKDYRGPGPAPNAGDGVADGPGWE